MAQERVGVQAQLDTFRAQRAADQVSNLYRQAGQLAQSMDMTASIRIGQQAQQAAEAATKLGDAQTLATEAYKDGEVTDVSAIDFVRYLLVIDRPLIGTLMRDPDIQAVLMEQMPLGDIIDMYKAAGKIPQITIEEAIREQDRLTVTQKAKKGTAISSAAKAALGLGQPIALDFEGIVKSIHQDELRGLDEQAAAALIRQKTRSTRIALERVLETLTTPQLGKATTLVVRELRQEFDDHPHWGQLSPAALREVLFKTAGWEKHLPAQNRGGEAGGTELTDMKLEQEKLFKDGLRQHPKKLEYEFPGIEAVLANFRILYPKTTAGLDPNELLALYNREVDDIIAKLTLAQAQSDTGRTIPYILHQRLRRLSNDEDFATYKWLTFEEIGEALKRRIRYEDVVRIASQRKQAVDPKPGSSSRGARKLIDSVVNS